jgi:hypothetical protein
MAGAKKAPKKESRKKRVKEKGQPRRRPGPESWPKKRQKKKAEKRGARGPLGLFGMLPRKAGLREGQGQAMRIPTRGRLQEPSGERGPKASGKILKTLFKKMPRLAFKQGIIKAIKK